MNYIIRSILVISLSAMSACDRSPAPEQPAAASAPVDIPVTPTNEAGTATLPLEPGQYTVDLTGNDVAIRANQVNELVLFKGVAARAKFQLFAENFDWKTVSVDIHAGSLHAAVAKLVSAYPYEIVLAPDETGQQEVLSEVVIGKPAPVSEHENSDEKKKNKKALDPGQQALLYIKAFDPLGQQQAYLEKLRDPTPEIRAAAAKEIDPTSENLPVLVDMLANDPSPEARIAATWPLEVIEGTDAPQAIEALVKCLDDKDYVVVAECVKSLGFIGDETTVVYLTPLLTHPDEDVRTEALDAIRFLQ